MLSLLVHGKLRTAPLSDHDFVDGLLKLSLQQVSFIRNSLNRQLDLVFVLDPSMFGWSILRRDFLYGNLL